MGFGVFQTELSKTFNCAECNKDEKRAKGCVRPTKTIRCKLDCPICPKGLSGVNERRKPKCHYHPSTKQIHLHRCPQWYMRRMNSLLKHYLTYRKYGAWPDGRGRLFQPMQLLWVFDFWDVHYNAYQRQMGQE